jgi:RNA polymerase sigma-B factor
MPGTDNSIQSRGHLEDLDVSAVAYARLCEDASPRRRRQLRDELIAHCLPFAGRIARRYRGRGEPIDDLEQVARLGLVKAVDRYHPERGSFTAFAASTMAGELKRHFRDTTWTVHVPRRLQDLNLDIRRATVELTHTLMRSPSVAEIARHFSLSEDAVREARQCAACYAPTSLNAPIDRDGSSVLGDLVGSTDETLDSLTDRLTVAELLQRLPERERGMLLMRFYGNHTQAQIADQFGVSQMHVSRLISRALTWLREAMLSDVPPSWPGTGLDGNDLLVWIIQDDNAVIVRLCGELDCDNANRLRSHLRHAVCAAGVRRVVVDLAGVPLLDAAAVSVLWEASRAATAARVALTFTSPRQYVAGILTMFGLGSVVAG